MLKNLLQQRNVVTHNSAHYFKEEVYEVQNNLEVFGIQATRLNIEDSRIVAGYILEDKIYLKGLQPGETTIVLHDEQNETAELRIIVACSGSMMFEIIPCLKNLNTTFVYFKKIMNKTVVAVDFKEALLQYLVVKQMLTADCSIEEVDYESFHPNILKNSEGGRFILGNHSNGLPITNGQEYALANRIVTLKFTKINYLHNAMKKVLDEELTIIFIITDQIVSDF